METESIIRKPLEAIKNNPGFQHLPKHFLYSAEIKTNALLFIGINPSAEEEQAELASYKLEQSGNPHPYFKRFAEVAKECKTEWTHLDLLFFRETKQNTIQTILKAENGVQFICDQLAISDALIKKCMPQAIICCNTLARRFLGKDKVGKDNVWLGYEFVFDNELGTYLWKDVPVFFSGMLTGQRALDNGSYERLKWQIRRALIIQSKRKIEGLELLKKNFTAAGKHEEVARLRDTEKIFEIRHQELSF